RDEMLSRYLGPTVIRAMADDDGTQVYVNPQDGAIRLDTRSRGKIASGTMIDAHRVEMFLNAVAARLGVTLTSDSPRLEAELPAATFAGSRLQGFVPPVTSGPAFNIRKPPSVVYSLDDYVAGGTLTRTQCAALQSGVTERYNILIAGGTNTGKTTLANAVLREITDRFPSERLVVLEDTVELQCAARDHLALRTNHHVTLADLVKSALRQAPTASSSERSAGSRRSICSTPGQRDTRAEWPRCTRPPPRVHCCAWTAWRSGPTCLRKRPWLPRLSTWSWSSRAATRGAGSRISCASTASIPMVASFCITSTLQENGYERVTSG